MPVPLYQKPNSLRPCQTCRRQSPEKPTFLFACLLVHHPACRSSCPLLLEHPFTSWSKIALNVRQGPPLFASHLPEKYLHTSTAAQPAYSSAACPCIARALDWAPQLSAHAVRDCDALLLSTCSIHARLNTLESYKHTCHSFTRRSFPVSQSHNPSLDQHLLHCCLRYVTPGPIQKSDDRCETRYSRGGLP